MPNKEFIPPCSCLGSKDRNGWRCMWVHMDQKAATDLKEMIEGKVLIGEITPEQAKKEIENLALDAVDNRPNQATIDRRSLKYYCKVPTKPRKQLGCNCRRVDNLAGLIRE